MRYLASAISNIFIICIAGICSLSSAAVADSASRPVTLRDDSVIYAQPDRESRSTVNLNSSTVYYLQMELDNASGRWCALSDSKNLFVGYTLCDELETWKKQPPKQKPARTHVKRSGSDRSAGKAVSGGADKGSEPDSSLRKPGDNSRVYGSASGKVSGGDASDKSSAGRLFVVISLIFLLVFATTILFLITVGLAYAIYRYRHDHRISGDQEAIPEDERLLAAHEENGAGHDHIVKVTPEGVGNLAKCQICGTIQILGYDAKCINCRATITHYIKVDHK